jgi:GT2 family glycosyltransferase
MLLRRTAIEKVGLLDDKYFLYGEDIDLCYRIKQAGFKIYYVPRAEIIHYGGVGSRIMSHKNIIEFHRSMLIFYKKHYRKKYGLVVTWLVYAGICLKCSINLILNAFRQEKYVGSKKP